MQIKQGLIVVNKEPGWTSHDVVSRMRGICGTRRVGHAGTLDPIATGVLPVFFGRATRAAEYFQEHDKEYIASFVTGIKTDTQDVTGNVIDRSDITVSKNRILEVLGQFTGRILQTPPMYSAKKVQGKKLYEYARSGKEVVFPPVEIVIHSLELLKQDSSHGTYTIKVSCSKGTYIRTLCNDMGDTLGCYAAMSFLCRTRHGKFSLCEAYTLEELSRMQKEQTLDEVVHTTDKLFEDLPQIRLDAQQEKLYKNGVRFETDTDCEGLYTLYSESGEFLALGRVIIKEGRRLLSAEKNFYDTEQDS